MGEVENLLENDSVIYERILKFFALIFNRIPPHEQAFNNGMQLLRKLNEAAESKYFVFT